MIRFLLLALLFIPTTNVFANATIPTTDSKGSADNPIIGRFQGSYIISYAQKGFDELTFPLSSLKPVEGKRDNHNNIFFEPEKSKTLEGRRTRLVYLNPAGFSPLEVIRNYEQELKSKGGVILYTCKKGDCGGADTRSSSGGGGEMSLSMYLWPAEYIKEAHFTNGNCAQTATISDQRYMVMEAPENNAVISVHTYLLNDNRSCKAFNNRTIAVVDIMEVQQMEAKMVTIKAEEMADAISSSGRVALYGIYFDFNKADIKSESTDTLEQIVKFLAADSEMRLLVVGHTDNVGNYQANMVLSTKRAEAVVTLLTTTYGVDKNRLMPLGVSFACPVASNSSEEGRAKNRRVELVNY